MTGALEFDAERLARLDAYVADKVAQRTLSGVDLCIARHGHLVHRCLQGWQDREANAPLSPDAIYQIASQTKAITAVAVLMLIEEGRLVLDQPVAEVLPAFADTPFYVSGEGADMVLAPQKSPMTVRHLLTHASGLSYGWDDSPVEALYRRQHVDEPDLPPLPWVERLASVPLLFQPGTRYCYGLSFDVLGVLVEAAAGVPFSEYLRERIFAPLGMVDTAFYVRPEAAERIPRLYNVETSGIATPIRHARRYRSREMPLFCSGGGGLFSTTADMGRFAQMLLSEGELDGARILSPAAVRTMASSYLPLEWLGNTHSGPGFVGEGQGLGVGVVVDPAATGVLGPAGIFGIAGAFATDFWVDPTNDLYVILMQQIIMNGRLRMRRTLRNLVYQALVR